MDTQYAIYWEWKKGWEEKNSITKCTNDVKDPKHVIKSRNLISKILSLRINNSILFNFLNAYNIKN